MHEIYRPILRGYFGVFAFYYVAMTPTHIWYLRGIELLVMTGVSIAAALWAFFGLRHINRTKRAVHTTDLMLLVMNVLVIANVVVALSIEFAPEKLTYFVIMAILFALASVSLWQSVASIVIASLGLVYFLNRLDAQAMTIFSFLVFGTALSSLAIAFFLRKAIISIASAKLNAEGKLEEARLVGRTLRKRSLTDSLTQLPNRRAFFEALRKAKSKAKTLSKDANADGSLWLALIDLDGFKAVNDAHGHIVGDLLLKEVASRLSSFNGWSAHVSRMGGDEFNIVINGPMKAKEVVKASEDLLASIAAAYTIESRVIHISGSLGLREIDPNVSSRELITQADFALMEAKERGKNCCIRFSDTVADKAHLRNRIETCLRNADFDEEIELVYQPQFDLESGQAVGVEILARWNSPEIGKVAPHKFIQIAEKSGLITQITTTVIEKAFTDLSKWDDPLPISINLSIYDLMSTALIDRIILLASDMSINPAMVEFEITETAMMSDQEITVTSLMRLSKAGFSIALDDFGAGYSNFNYLRRLPIGKLKVDQSFMANLTDPMTKKILWSLADMTRSLGLKFVIEGIERDSHLQVARNIGVHSAQGYFLAQPMRLDELLPYIEDFRAGRQSLALGSGRPETNQVH